MVARSTTRSVSSVIVRGVVGAGSGGDSNLLLAPRDLSDGVWTHGTVVVDPDTETDPNGGSEADGVDFVATNFGFYGNTAGDWVAEYPEDITFTTDWVRYEREVTTPVSCVSLRVYPARIDGTDYIYQTVEVLPETSYVLRWWAKVDGSNTYIWNVTFRRGTLQTPTTPITLTADLTSITADNANLTADQTEAIIS